MAEIEWFYKVFYYLLWQVSCSGRIAVMQESVLSHSNTYAFVKWAYSLTEVWLVLMFLNPK